jgi:hypothetical protein
MSKLRFQTTENCIGVLIVRAYFSAKRNHQINQVYRTKNKLTV